VRAPELGEVAKLRLARIHLLFLLSFGAALTACFPNGSFPGPELVAEPMRVSFDARFADLPLFETLRLSNDGPSLIDIDRLFLGRQGRREDPGFGIPFRLALQDSEDWGLEVEAIQGIESGDSVFVQIRFDPPLDYESYENAVVIDWRPGEEQLLVFIEGVVNPPW